MIAVLPAAIIAKSRRDVRCMINPFWLVCPLVRILDGGHGRQTTSG
jgi:hypothetical protein